ELARCRIVADQRFDQIVGRFLANGKTDVNALVFLLRGSTRRRMRGIEDYGDRSRLVTVRCPQQAEKTEPGFFQARRTDSAVQQAHRMQEVVAIDQVGPGHGPTRPQTGLRATSTSFLAVTGTPLGSLTTRTEQRASRMT